MHPVTHDLHPAVDRLTTIVSAVKDDQLDAPTPCRDTTVGALLDHVDGLALAFTAAATKTGLASGQPSADASRLPADWRSRIPARLAALADAWADDAA